MILGNSKIRALYNQVILTFNNSDLAIEIKKLIAEAVFYQVQAKADEAINEEMNTPADALLGDENENGEIVLREDKANAKSIPKNQLGELSE